MVVEYFQRSSSEWRMARDSRQHLEVHKKAGPHDPASLEVKSFTCDNPYNSLRLTVTDDLLPFAT
jgi:hypothetical protein